MTNVSTTNLTLIGMPGVGKSTVGVLLAKATERNFVDADVYIQSGVGRNLQEIIDTEGLEAFCKLEEEYLLCLDVRGYVVATGGSAVYSRAGMKHLKSTGPVIWLDLPLEDIRRRLSNLAVRGVVKPADQTLDDLFAGRRPLYQQWADLTIPCAGKTQDEIVAEIVGQV
ncbi:MAG: shikimate kinase [Phycisphaerae bacterium]|nr:shikimate kinase [Phycisphaerae bacterium]